MSIQLDMEQAGGYLHMHPRGTYVREDVFLISRRVLDECRQHDCSRILIDTSDLDMEALPPSETRFMVQHIAKTFIDTHGITVAFVVPPVAHQDFSAALADLDRPGLMAFMEQKAALDWLLK
jgi:hypothetical protein